MVSQEKPSSSDSLAAVVHLFAGRLGGAFVQDARRVAGFLEVHAEVDQVDQDLHLALGLGGAAHHPEGKPGLAVFGDEAGDDGVEGPLVRLVDVGMALPRG